MNRTELIERLTTRMGYSEEEAARVVDAMMESMTESLGRGDKITLPGIGTMAVVERASRRNADSDADSETDRVVRGIKFSPGKRLKEALTSLDFITKGLE